MSIIINHVAMQQLVLAGDLICLQIFQLFCFLLVVLDPFRDVITQIVILFTLQYHHLLVALLLGLLLPLFYKPTNTEVALAALIVTNSSLTGLHVVGFFIGGALMLTLGSHRVLRHLRGWPAAFELVT